MELTVRNTQVQQARLAITPELKQSIHMLKLTGTELISYLEEQCVDNPLLEVGALEDLQRDRWRGLTNSGSSADFLSLMKAAATSLEEELHHQLEFLPLDRDIRRAARFLAGSLDDKGYLTLAPAEAADILGLPHEAVQAGLTALQSLEPAGIGARSLQDCLLLQIQRDPHPDPIAAELVEKGLDLLGSGHLQEAAKRLGVTMARLKEAYRYIQGLDPRPAGRLLPGDIPAPILPDAEVSLQPEGIKVLLAPHNVPRLGLCSTYHELSTARLDSEGDVQAYVREKLRSAQGLIRSVEQRKVTLIRVITALMEEQIGFLIAGEAALRSLVLRDIAVKLDMHESTISRTVAGKHIRTPRGVMELKSFFSTGVEQSNGSLSSMGQIKHWLKNRIRSEDKSSPLSDRQLTDLLLEEGVEIKRRTVAKYREELGFEASHRRKKALE